MAEFRMPSLGADMDSGVLLEWRVKPGDAVKRGDIVAVVDTSKAEIEIEVFEDGVVEELLIPAGERVPVGTPIATINAGAPTEAAPATAVAVAAVPRANGTTAAAEETVAERAAVASPIRVEGRPGSTSTPLAAPGHRRRVSPIARRTAALLDVDLAGIDGTGPRGAVTKWSHS
jgi:pyruvate dehydrogenase E2 component (dihydrolipoamide acetyltransferase)